MSVVSRAVCINLDASKGRWKEFESGLNKSITDLIGPVERASAFTPETVPMPRPKWIDLSGQSWACYQSHLAQIERAIDDDIDDLLILEDDAVFDQDFEKRFSDLVRSVPPTWDLLYLGGLHKAKPYHIDEHYVQCRDTTLHHAWMLSRDGLRKVQKHMVDWEGLKRLRGRKPNKDQWVAQGIRMRQFTAYAPRVHWMVHQRAGRSDRNFKMHHARYGAARTSPIVKWPNRE